MPTLLHGTTLSRAERIFAEGPDPEFVEPGGSARAEGFSTCLQAGPFPLGTPEQYARYKAALYPTEGGPAIISVDVPDRIIALAVDDRFLPLSQGVVQFDDGSGLEDLRAVWSSLPKRVIVVPPS
jgi:hypothetical protein